MICRRCLQRASSTTATNARPIASSRQHPVARLRSARGFALVSSSSSNNNNSRSFTQTSTARYSTAPEASPATTTTTTEAAPPTTTTDGAAHAQPMSSCSEGTVMSGLNYFKNKTDPVALADDAYPEWLWRCLEVKKKAADADADEAGDEFSKSKKQRQLAAKRQRALEARMLASGDLSALAPKIPLQQQSVNLPANEAGTAAGAVAAAQAREDLRRAMHRERRAKIKEDNYLKSM